MRPVTLYSDDVVAALREIERASHENDLAEAANNCTITGTYTATRSLNGGTATLAQLTAFVATLITDLQKGGMNRTT